MSIRIAQGNILDAPENIIVHQVNCQGVMGGGVAKQIKEKWPVVFDVYKEFINGFDHEGLSRDKLLGQVVWAHIGYDRWVANIFSQLDYNKNGERKLQTDYDALRKGFIQVAESADWYGQSVAMPYMIGCCRGGGNWSKVLEMIYEVFEPFENVNVVIYEYLGR